MLTIKLRKTWPDTSPVLHCLVDDATCTIIRQAKEQENRKSVSLVLTLSSVA